VARIDLGLWNELVNRNRAIGLKRDAFKFVLADFDVGVFIGGIAFDDFVVLNFIAGFRVHLLALDLVARALIGLIETDFENSLPRGMSP